MEPTAEQKAAMAALTKVFLAFPNAGDEGERMAKFVVYWEVLCTLPPRAILAACDWACHQPGFLPSAGDLYAEGCKRIPRPLQSIPPPKPTPVNPEIVEKLRLLRAELIANEFKS